MAVNLIKRKESIKLIGNRTRSGGYPRGTFVVSLGRDGRLEADKGEESLECLRGMVYSS